MTVRAPIKVHAPKIAEFMIRPNPASVTWNAHKRATVATTTAKSVREAHGPVRAKASAATKTPNINASATNGVSLMMTVAGTMHKCVVAVRTRV